MKRLLFLFSVLAATFMPLCAGADEQGFVAVVKMDMMILPGTHDYLTVSINKASEEGAKLIVVLLDTPGGILQTTQLMTQEIFKSKVPVAIYVYPKGATATSAGVFITLAGHVAAMAPGTSIGAAHPVSGEGKDIEGDMRQKAENMASAMVRSISEQRGRNTEWAEKAVKESSSLTEKEALEKRVVDKIADDIPDLLKKIKGSEVTLGNEKVVLGDYSALPVRYYEMHYKDRVMNVLANPNVAALLWLGATTGLSIELYNPGAILPGVVGVICLILALVVSQIIPVNEGGVILLIVGALMIGAEMYVTSGLLGVGGIIAMVLGAMYLIDVTAAPGLSVSTALVGSIGALAGLFLFLMIAGLRSAQKKKVTTGKEGMIGLKARALENFTGKGSVFVKGAVWRAESESGLIEKDDEVEVVSVSGLTLRVKKI